MAKKHMKRKICACIIIFAVAVMAIFAAGCRKDAVVIDDTSQTRCPLNMINPLSCKQGTVTYYDENQCSVTKCREDVTEADLGILGSENT